MTVTRERPVVADAVVPDDGARRERWIATGLLIFTFLFALVAQTLLFDRSTTMGGDVEYHRGVAFTMSAGSWAGEGPIHGVISYFGGLYPFVLGWGSRLLGVSFDSLLSVLSWPFVLALPLALLWLGRRLWPGQVLEPAVLAFIGTIGSSLALDDQAMWVNSVLPSGSNLWPVYPRDVTLVLLVVALAIVVGDESRLRSFAAGAVAGVAICVHAQIGVYAVVVVAAYALWRAWPERAWRRWSVESAIVGGTAFLLSVWWWLPRLEVVIDTRRLLLQSYPGLKSPDTSLVGLVVALGAVGILAVPGVVIALRHHRRTERFAAVWLLTLAPFALIGSVVGDIGVMTPRRVLFLAAVPLVICAAIATTALLRRGPILVMLTIVIAVIVIPSASEALQTRDLISVIWARQPAGDAFADATWKPALGQLRDAMVDRGSVQVIAPDNDALYIWKQSGAQPFSFLPSGSIKLGFDPGRTTDYSYLERVHLLDQAVNRGLPGLCRLASRTNADFLVLRRDGNLLGTHDTTPSSRYRVDPSDRTTQTINRVIRPGLRYLDRSALEVLQVAPNHALPLDWSSPHVRRLDVYQDRRRPIPPLVLMLPNGRRIVPAILLEGHAFVLSFPTPDGIPPGTALVANKRGRARINRIVGYEPVPNLPGPTHGPVVLDPAKVC